MTIFTVIFLIVNALALMALPRKLAPLPLLVGCCYMTAWQSFSVGPISFTVIRVLVAVGVFRCVGRAERIAGRFNAVDKLMIAWMTWIALSSFLFPGDESPLVFNLGQAYNIGGIYFLFRVFCQDFEDLERITRMIAWLLTPIAVEMATEHFTGRNMFSVFGGFVIIRDGKFRAIGPFAHAILAGSVGAACFPLMLGILRSHKREAIMGLASCLLIVVASNSSGPIMSLAFAIFALWVWRYRTRVHLFQWGAVAIYCMLEMVMRRPAYYIIGEIDLTGSSTGWHRARLIESAIDHLGEWWLAGTNYTRHWMATGVSCSPNHTDITNYYILMGVWAGLPLMFIFIAMILVAFRYVGNAIRSLPESAKDQAFLMWCAGAALFSHATTCISVAYFDQSYIFLFLSIAAISSLKFAEVEAEERVPEPENVPALPPMPSRNVLTGLRN